MRQNMAEAEAIEPKLKAIEKAYEKLSYEKNSKFEDLK
jgi:hypothetical protein